MSGAAADGLETALVQVLESVGRGSSVTSTWLRRRWPSHWESLVDALRVDALVAPDALADDRVGPYAVESFIGRGGMGTVFRARRVEGGGPEVVALKVLHGRAAASPAACERFRREAELGAAIRDAHLVRTVAVGSVRRGPHDVPYLALELVEGRSLREALDADGPHPEEACLGVGRDVAHALWSVHAAGAVHRDVKLENVLVSREGFVRLTDLGVALLADETDPLADPRSFVGTPVCAAPEQFDGGPVDGRADLYGLGVLLYELATGRHPHADRLVRLEFPARTPPPPPSAVRAGLSEFFDAVVLALLDPAPDRRFASAAEAVEAFERRRHCAWWRNRGARSPGARPLRGRDEALAALARAWEKARRGRGGAVLVTAEDGFGKSRLVEEFARRVEAEGGLRLRAASGAGFVGEASAPLAELVRCALPSSTTAAFDGGPADPGARTAHLCGVVSRMSRGRPTLLVLEDLHLGDADDRATFRAFAAAADETGLLVVGTAWPTAEAELLGGDADAGVVVVVALGPLDDETTAEIAADALGIVRADDPVAVRIAAAARGSPFFARLLAESLATSGVLRRRSDGALVPGSADVEGPPSDLAAAVAGRAARLAAEDRAVLDLAACADAEIDVGLCAHALGRAPRDVVASFARIETTTGLVRRRSPGLGFEHELVRSAAREAVPASSRAEFHRRLAAAHEAGAGDAEPARRRRSIAAHLVAAGDPRAAAVVVDALDRSIADRRWDDAASLAERALEIAALPRAVRVETLLRTVVAHRMRTRFERADAASAEALRLAADVDPATRARVLACRARACLDWGRVEEVRPALDEARTCDPDVAGSDDFVATQVALLRRLGRPEEGARLLRGIAAAVPGPRRIDLLVQLAKVLRDCGRMDEVRALLPEIDAAAAATADPRLLYAAIDLDATVHLFERADGAAALVRYARALGVARRIGDARLVSETTFHRAMALQWQGRLSEAAAEMRTAESAFRGLGLEARSWAVAGGLAHVLFALDRNADALAALDRSDLLRGPAGEGRDLCANACLRAQILASVGAVFKAREALAPQEASGAEQSPIDAWRVFCARARILMAEGDDAGVVALARAVEPLVERGGRLDWSSEFHQTWGDAALALGFPDEARAHWTRADREARETGQPWSALASLAGLARLDPSLAPKLADEAGEAGERALPCVRVVVDHALWLATGDEERLRAAHDRAQAIRRDAPPERFDDILRARRELREAIDAWTARAG